MVLEGENVCYVDLHLQEIVPARRVYTPDFLRSISCMLAGMCFNANDFNRSSMLSAYLEKKVNVGTRTSMAGKTNRKIQLMICIFLARSPFCALFSLTCTGAFSGHASMKK